MRLLDAHLDAWRDTATPVDPKKSGDVLTCSFLFSLVWGVGAAVDDAGRARFDSFLRALLRKETIEELSTPGAPVPLVPPATRSAGAIKASKLFPEVRGQ